MAARYLGVNLAWREDRPGLPANETGVAVIDSQGLVLDAGWRRGVAEVLGWAGAVAGAGDALMFVDAPLVVRTETGQRLCETQVGQRYGRWKVSANATNPASPLIVPAAMIQPNDSSPSPGSPWRNRRRPAPGAGSRPVAEFTRGGGFRWHRLGRSLPGY